jgi:photosystem II stability/assembly factor-like uncharacterized protein
MIIFTLVTVFPKTGSGQEEELAKQFDGHETFRQIVEKTQRYLESMPDNGDKEEFGDHFARWAYYQSLHLGPSGEFVNINKKTLEAVSSRGDSPLASANGSWSFVGPSNAYLNNPSAALLGNGRVDRMAFHPTDPNTIYVGSPAGGLWRTTNGGSSWTPISNYIPSLGISGIVVDHSNPNTLYVLTGDGDTDIPSYINSSGYLQLSVGVMVSYDAGVNWQSTGQLSAIDYCGFRLIQDPDNTNILIAATSDGIYRTTNAGSTWAQVATGRYYDVEFKPGTPSTVYASGKGTFIYSTNWGSTWNTGATFDYPLCSTGRIEIAVSPNSSNKVYLLAGPSTNGAANFCGFYLSTNSGVSFTRLTNNPNILGDETGTAGDQSEYDMGIAVKPSDNQKVVTCGLVVYRSTNGGSTFTDATTYWESGGNYIHPDCHSVEYNPLNNYVYAATDGGFFKSTNDGSTWTNLWAGINTAQFYHLDDYDADANILLGGCQDNGVKYRPTNTSNFSHLLCCDGGDAAINYNDGTQGFATTNKSIFHYSDFTNTSPTTVDVVQAFPQIELNTSNPDILYYSYSRVKKFILSTLTYSTLGGSDVLGGWVVRTCPSNSNRIYTAGGSSAFATNGDMFLSSDGGATWSTISANTGFPATFPRISDIGIRPNNSLFVYACFSGYTDGLKVLYSSDGGNSWANISYDLPNIPIWSIQVDAANNLYIGGDIGVYFHAANSTNWEPFYNGLPNVPVSDLAINESADQMLASTFGRGVWKSALHATCPADLAITANLTGNYFASTSNSITINSTLTGGTGSSATLRAGNSVTLLQGFQVTGAEGAKFSAGIGPCGSGMPPEMTGQAGPVYPAELNDYAMGMTRHDGTLEVIPDGHGAQKVVLRMFTGGNARILLATAGGQFIGDVANDNFLKGTQTFSPVDNLSPGSYYLYLVVNGTVMHLQELTVK